MANPIKIKVFHFSESKDLSSLDATDDPSMEAYMNAYCVNNGITNANLVSMTVDTDLYTIDKGTVNHIHTVTIVYT